MKHKIIDCVTFFEENYIFELRYHVLKDVVDTFVVCESTLDHRGRKKELNFIHKDGYDQSKIRYVVLDHSISDQNDPWHNQAIQRDYMLQQLGFVDPEDYVFFSDPDEIPNPAILQNFCLHKKYGIFLQACFNYKFNLFNPHESPWEGTRVCKKKHLKSIDFMRQHVRVKNLRYGSLRLDKERSIELFDHAGWHFNNIADKRYISKKLKTYAHSEFSGDEFASPDVIEEKIHKQVDLFGRGHTYRKVDLDHTFPLYLQQCRDKYGDFVLE